jgi:hypothetical protein
MSNDVKGKPSESQANVTEYTSEPNCAMLY